MKDPSELSFPAQAVYSELERTGEIMPREEFCKEFDDDYDVILEELSNAGRMPESSSSSWGNSKGVLFKNRTTRYSLDVH
ncbi:hypothetical protein ACIRL0_10735 [Streptomyces sp. NPDC102365]|uniref:hypothetical protein n=1 Tax=Streptomyces sp. NPDC102365 TaxID=3366162 RepID=UPI00380A24FE